MNTILDKIIAHKRTEVAQKSELVPVKLLEQSIYFHTPVVSLSRYLTRPDKIGIIAEFKRKSPSKGDINRYAQVEEVSIGYMQGGASALSILTDTTFFGGKNADLQEARKFNFCPILRKDFIVSEYQILEARSIGADAILLLASALSYDEIRRFTAFARSLGLEVLIEIHEEAHLDKISPEAQVIGVNNRDLRDFSVDMQRSMDLLPFLPSEMVPISESGLSMPETVADLKQAGFKGFLMGEAFMTTDRPGQACRQFIQDVRRIETARRHPQTIHS
ncbi:MAG: indole-3-glycerol phosphate synthase TrpC [Lewinellaceae bacterium]|nr:indole-3-glycerol phosphate synthase TrpC [Saprospiraceae bacterium]MCB9311895.1 indole-3-glycerol phosphate synthase TrpC [Lewinellaceae bacterium]HRW74469.1 indole-3-glycerol phosphate synthase TrpC [Saprospiraceae bacterium]